MAEKSGTTKQVVFLVVIVLAVAAFVVGTVVTNKKSAPGNHIIVSGDRAPEFTLPSLDGRKVDLAEYRGKVVMVHFWATWCPPCVEEIPTLAKLNQELKGTDFVMLAVSVDEGGSQAVTSFLRQKQLSVPVLLDTDRRIANSYGTYKFPETYLVDRDGVVRNKVIGPADWRDPAAVKFIRDMMAAR